MISGYIGNTLIYMAITAVVYLPCRILFVKRKGRRAPGRTAVREACSRPERAYTNFTPTPTGAGGELNQPHASRPPMIRDA